MAKNNALFAMLTGAALAGGILYLKKLGEKQQAAADEVDVDTGDLPGEESEGNGGWRATYTVDGEEVSAEEVRARFKEEAGKAVNSFKEDAKVVSEEILIGLKKALAEMKTAVEEAKKATAERHAAEAAADEGECCCKDEEKDCCCKAEEKVKEAACCCKEKAEEAVEEVKETVEKVVEEIKDAVKD